MFFVEKQTTIRKVAEEYKVSKSQVHQYLREFVDGPLVLECEKGLAVQVSELLNKNKKERHIRGGAATRKMFERKRLETDKAEAKT